MKYKINKTILVTPLGEIVIQDKLDENSVFDEDMLVALLKDWEVVLTAKSFRCPSQSNSVYVFPKGILENSYIKVDTEEVNEEI